MTEVFLNLLNMSIAAGWLVLAVVALRFVFKKAPRAIICILWVLVAVRLLFPISIESALSLLPSAQTVPADIVYAAEPAVQTGIASMDALINPILIETLAPKGLISINPIQVLLFIAANLWVLGMVLMVGCAVFSYLRIRRKVSAAMPVRDNIYICDYIDTPFILGIIRPNIYLPSSLSEEASAHVIAHEEAHLARRDHWWKPLGYMLLTVYWFNPLIWVAYILLCRDIELACDEKVVKGFSPEGKKAYSNALLACSVKRTMIAACPLAFGEVGVKARIKSVLNYKKPAFWIVLLAVAACIAAAVCFLTNPETQANDGEGGSHSFQAYVLETGENSILVQPAEGTAERASADMIWVSLDTDSAEPLPDITVGDTLTVVYDGVIAESYPVQIQNARLIQTSESDWGITLTAADVTSTGITLVCTQSGGIPNNRYTTGRVFTLERYTDTGWEAVTTISDRVFTMEAILIPQNHTIRWALDWATTYGSLPPGTYRVGKSVCRVQQSVWEDLFKDTPHLPLETLQDHASQEWMYYAKFEITAEQVLSQAVTQALDNHWKTERPLPDGLYHSRPHLILGTAEENGLLTVYLVMLHRSYRISFSQIEPELMDDELIPLVLRFRLSDDGSYTLTKYLEPKDESAYAGVYAYDAFVGSHFPEALWEQAQDRESLRQQLEIHVDIPSPLDSTIQVPPKQ